MNPFYNATSPFIAGTLVRASAANQKFSAVEGGFDGVQQELDFTIKLPENFTGNRVIPTQTYLNTIVWLNGDGDLALYSMTAFDTSVQSSLDASDAAAVSESNAASSATAAANSATASANSATAAGTSETNAAGSATAASNSASAASTSETNAAGSATAASNSASAASTSETNAAGSATAASTSETNAAGSATAAAGSASAASDSETNAAASETKASQWADSAVAVETGRYSAKFWADDAESSKTAAANSASAASTSETNAAGSATDASDSASAASTSETNAGNSATAANTSAVNALASENAAASSESNAASSESAALSYRNDAQTAKTDAEQARDLAMQAYADFDDRYLGPKDTAPTTDNDGSPLDGGDLYFDTTAEEMRLWTGSEWVAAYVAASDYVPKTRSVDAGTGLSGGGTLDADRSFSVNYGTVANTAAQGNDSRIINGQTAFSWGDHASAGYEPGFSKNNAFNKNFGSAAGTVAQGDDARINNGQTAFGWGDHASAGYDDTNYLYNPAGGAIARSARYTIIQNWSQADPAYTFESSAFVQGDVVSVSSVKGLKTRVQATRIYLPNGSYDTEVFIEQPGRITLAKYNTTAGYWMLLP